MAKIEKQLSCISEILLRNRRDDKDPREKDDLESCAQVIESQSKRRFGRQQRDLKCAHDDRKRLKERLKEAMETEKMQLNKTTVSAKMNWIEYLFGICEPDGRIGKEGSRCPSFTYSDRSFC